MLDSVCDVHNYDAPFGKVVPSYQKPRLQGHQPGLVFCQPAVASVQAGLFDGFLFPEILGQHQNQCGTGQNAVHNPKGQYMHHHGQGNHTIYNRERKSPHQVFK